MTITKRRRIAHSDDLRALIRQLAAEDPDPAHITTSILETLDEAEAMVVAWATLHDYVRRVATAPVPLQPTYQTAAGHRTFSPKVAMVRDWVAAQLATSVCVITDSKKAWKRLGECSADDLHALAAERRRKSEQVAAEGRRYARYAAAVEDAGVPTLASLDHGTLEAVLR